jgi:hypothetical protein
VVAHERPVINLYMVVGDQVPASLDTTGPSASQLSASMDQ